VPEMKQPHDRSANGVVHVVDDDASVRTALARLLTAMGYEVKVHPSAASYLLEPQSKSPSCLILDVRMPHVSGLEVCKTIRQDSAIPILIVTARDSDESEVEGLAMGADDYIKKPFNPNVLVARVQALLRRHDKTKQLRFKDLVIDPETMSITRDGRVITLTTTRFNLLLALASRPQAVLSRAQLVDQIYSDPSEHFVYDRTIDAHIKALRQSIERDPKHPQLIETVFGSGYRFTGESK